MDLEVLLERDVVLSALSELVDGVGGGIAATVFLVAGAGLGKSSLLDWVARLARQRGLVTVRAGGDVMESGLGFGLLDQVMLGLDGGSRSAIREAGPGVDARSARFVKAWQDLQSTPPGLIVLDDLHWSDVESLAFVSFLSRRLRTLSRWSVVGALRPWPQHALQVCRSLVHDDHASTIELSALTESGTARLLEAHLGAPVAPGLAHQTWTATAGNPLLLHQVADIMNRGGRVEYTSGTATDVADRVLLARFGGLSETGMRWLRAAAVLGSRFRPEVAAAVAGLDEAELAGAMEAALYTGVITGGDDGRCEFRHPLFRDAVDQDLPTPLRIMLHDRAMRELADRGLDAEAAVHAIRAHRIGDRVSIDLLARTGASALAQGAFETAVDRLGTAVDLSGANPDGTLLLAWGESLAACRRPADAVTVLDRLLDRRDLPPATRIQALRLLARAEGALYRTAASGRHYAQAAEAADAVSPGLTVDVLVEWAQSLIYVDPGRALPIAVRARDRAGTCSPQVRWWARIAWLNSVLLTGDPAGLAEIPDVGELSDLLREPEGVSPWAAAAATITVAVMTELYEADDDVFRRNLAAAHLAGAPGTAVGYAISHFYGLLRLGRLSEALAALHEARSWIDVAPKWEAIMTIGYAWILLITGRLEESREHLTRARELAAARDDPHVQLYVHDIAGHRALLEGDPDRAGQEYWQLEELDTRRRLGDAYLSVWAGHAIQAYLATGHRGDADRVIQRLREASGLFPGRWPRIALETALAMRADTDGDAGRAEQLYQAALAHLQQVDLPLEKMQTLLAYAGSLRRHGHAVRARALLREAISIGQASGAHWLVDYAHTELSIAGGRFRVPRDPGQLTPAEQRIADLATAGRSNREIAAHLGISETTVETHLGHVYQKKGITSRRQLTTTRTPTTTPLRS